MPKETVKCTLHWFYFFHLVHLRSKTAFDQYCEKEAQENDKHGNRASKSIAASVEDHVNHQGTCTSLA